MRNDKITVCLTNKEVVYEDCSHKEDLEINSRYKYISDEYGFAVKDEKTETLYPWNNILYILREVGEQYE